ncbi:hypothetical protein L6164_026795 [Bauhinia variegata]|uniref:Uncharacterized protein n=1 Tax=Bauhinia variegata TaxID=167791 RepID=A0ACB9LRX6_BAUVA|nr:hypothetical protein L6164_026795 [Bauhinia variegata]
MENASTKSAIPQSYAMKGEVLTAIPKTLPFRILPASRKYFAAAAPGSFFGRLFPRETLHFVHSSASLHWLSEVPEKIADRNSDAWNKGRIYCVNSPKEVADAYAAQQRKDLENFMHARAQELVSNGLMVIRMAAAPDEILDSDTKPGEQFELLGSCLLDMTKEGLGSEEKVDSFNLPIFYSSVNDVMAILGANGCFSIEWLQVLSLEHILGDLTVEVATSTCRAVLEELLEKHFGSGIIDELFNRFGKKVKEFPHLLNAHKQGIVQLFVILKRKLHDRP